MVRKATLEVGSNEIKQLLLDTVKEEFLIKYYIRINRAVATYSALRRAYKDSTRELKDYDGFKESFFDFYGIGRFVSKNFQETYYKKMEYLREKKEYDIAALTEELRDSESKKIQFSFTTKLLNIMNDEKYAIYDSFVAKVFHFPPTYSSTENYVRCYEKINSTYHEIQGDGDVQRVIADFRKVFKCSEDLPDMRIIDILIWTIGATMKK